MTHPRSASPAAWPLRWLLVVLTLAGLGLLHGAHCAETVAAGTPHLGLSAGDRLHATTDAGSATGSDPARGDHLTGTVRPVTSATADNCGDAEARTAGLTVRITATPAHLPVATARVGATRSRPAALRPRLCGVVTLSQLGVSRI